MAQIVDDSDPTHRIPAHLFGPDVGATSSRARRKKLTGGELKPQYYTLLAAKQTYYMGSVYRYGR